MSFTLHRLRFLRLGQAWLTLCGGLLLATFAAMLLTATAHAQSTTPTTAGEEQTNATIQAVSYAPLLKGATVVPEAAISSALNEDIIARIEQALQARGFKIADDGLYVVQFDYTDAGYEKRKKAYTEGDKASTDIKIGIADGKVKSAETGVKLPVQDGKIGKPDSRIPVASKSLNRLHIVIAKAGGAKMWEGSIEGYFAGGHRPVAEAMVEALVQQIGITVEKTGYQLEGLPE